MADFLTSIANVPNALQAEYWQRMFLSTLEANLLFDRFGIPATMPPHSGRSVFWPRFENIAYTVGAASEGFDPSASPVSVNVVSALMTQYKQWYRLSDLWSETNLPGTREALIQRMAYRGALTVDSVVRNAVLTAGGSAQIGGTAVARNSMKRNSSFQMDVDEIRQAVRRLRKNNVPTFANGLYVGVVHPHTEYDLQSDSNWMAIVQYTTEGINRAYQGKIGNVFGADFFVTTQAKVVANGASAAASADVAQTYVIGEEHYGVAMPRDVEVIIKDPFPGSPLNSYAAYGWKLWMTSKELASSRMTRIETVLSTDV